MDSAKNNQPAIIFFLWKEGATGADITRRLQNVFGDDAMGKSAVYKWIGQFAEGRNSTDIAEGRGRPRSSASTENVKRVQALIEEDRRITVRDIAECMDMSTSTVHKILVEELQLSKLCARWVPRMLTVAQMEVRVSISKANLSLADRDPEFYDRLLTVDETWIHFYDPESREQSRQWLPRGSAPPLKAKVQPSLGKVMATVFWDSTGIILVDYLERGATINAEYYSNLLQNDVREAMRRKRPGKLSKRPLLLQDNARPHTAHHTMAVLERLGWDILQHPPYSPDLAPSDFHLFPSMKKYLRGFHFNDLQELQGEVLNWVRMQDTTFFQRGMEKLLDRYEACVNMGGNYVEKCTLDTDDD